VPEAHLDSTHSGCAASGTRVACCQWGLLCAVLRCPVTAPLPSVEDSKVVFGEPSLRTLMKMVLPSVMPSTGAVLECSNAAW